MKFTNLIKNYLEFIIYFILLKSLKSYEKKENTLLFINTGEIGDLVVSSILLENDEIFSSYKRVCFLIKENYLKLFSDYKGPIKIVGYNYSKYKYSIIYKISFINEIRKAGYETIIQLTAARGILNEEMTHLFDGKENFVISSFTKYLGGILSSYFNKKYQKIIAARLLNEYDKHLELIDYFNKEKKEISFYNKKTFNVNRKTYPRIENRIIIAPFTSIRNRDLRINIWQEVIEHFSEDYEVLLLGSESQKKDLMDLKSRKLSVKVIAGEVELSEIASVLSGSKLFIGLDSGVSHIALKTNIPMLAVIGGGEYGRFFPYKESPSVKYLYHKMECFLCHWQCYHNEMYCLTKVTSQNIIAESTKILLK